MENNLLSIKNDEEYKMFNLLKQEYRNIRKELEAFLNDENVPLNMLSIMSTGKNVVRSDQSLWKVFGFLFHGVKPRDYIESVNIEFNNYSKKDILEFLQYTENTHFKLTRKYVDLLCKDEKNGIINVFFSVFLPGTKLGLHINNDPYMYRAHLGLKIPEGDIGFKVKNDEIRWNQGEIIIFDPTDPHTAWNLSNEIRSLLIVDFYKPEEDRGKMKQLEKNCVEAVMKNNPLSFGMSGGYFELDDQIKDKYALNRIG